MKFRNPLGRMKRSAIRWSCSILRKHGGEHLYACMYVCKCSVFSRFITTWCNKVVGGGAPRGNSRDASHRLVSSSRRSTSKTFECYNESSKNRETLWLEKYRETSDRANHACGNRHWRLWERRNFIHRSKTSSANGLFYSFMLFKREKHSPRYYSLRYFYEKLQHFFVDTDACKIKIEH